MRESTQPLTQVEFSEADHYTAANIARELGYEQTAYTSTSALWGLFCLPESPERWKGSKRALSGACIIKTRELGLLVVQSVEDLHLEHLEGPDRRALLERELIDAHSGAGGAESAKPFKRWLLATADDDDHTLQDAARELLAMDRERKRGTWKGGAR